MKLDEYKFMPIFPSAPVADPQVSPDGKRVIFTYSQVDMEEDKYNTHLWMLNLKKKKPTQFTYGKTGENNPRWSPKRDKILFLSGRLGEGDKEDAKPIPQLFVIPVAGGEAKKLTFGEEAVTNPQWSPDGKTILFNQNVFKGEKASEESDVKIIKRIKFRFDGKGYFVGKFNHLFTVSSSGGKAKQVTDGEYDVESASWSPDSKQVAFTTNIEEDADLTRYRNIYLVPAKGGDPELLWKGEGPVSNLSWSPDGKYIAFTGRTIEDPTLYWHRNMEVYVYSFKEKKAICLTSMIDRTLGYGASPEWSPDSKYVYFKVGDQGSSHIVKTSLSGDVEYVTEGKMNVGTFSLNKKKGGIIYSATNATTPYELYMINKDEPQKLTNLNKSLMKKLKISEPEEFWFTASDGEKVHGWIVKPHDYEGGEKYPTILEIHGGPRGAYGYTLGAAEHEFQVLAEHGYVVVYTNPRGSTGYGESFSRHISGHWGDRDYLDLMEAVDYVIDNYDYVDHGRLGCAGGSYGGWMTNWIVGHTDRFKAAVTMRSISNWYSMHGTSDIAFMEHDIGWGKDPWNNTEEILSKSPITYIENIKTPLLIIHSENDFRCPIPQGEELFIGLKKLGKETEFIRFPEESHGLSRGGKPKHRVERLQHIIRWFDRYLK